VETRQTEKKDTLGRSSQTLYIFIRFPTVYLVSAALIGPTKWE